MVGIHSDYMNTALSTTSTPSSASKTAIYYKHVLPSGKSLVVQAVGKLRRTAQVPFLPGMFLWTSPVVLNTAKVLLTVETSTLRLSATLLALHRSATLCQIYVRHLSSKEDELDLLLSNEVEATLSLSNVPNFKPHSMGRMRSKCNRFWNPNL